MWSCGAIYAFAMRSWEAIYAFAMRSWEAIYAFIILAVKLFMHF